VFTLNIENQAGDVLCLTQSRDYAVIRYSGLNPPPAVVSLSPYGASDGSRFNNARVDSRAVVITIQFLRDVERNRIALYRYARVKQYCKIHYTNDTRDVYCEGYVEAIDNDQFELGQKMQISILCPYPYLRSIREIITDISQTIALFEFPFAIGAEGVEFSSIEKTGAIAVENQGDVDTGVVIEITATGPVEAPALYNADTHGSMELGTSLQAGDRIRINTNRGAKRIELTRAGVTTNIINDLVPGADWFQLPPGRSGFTYTADSGQEFMGVQFHHVNQYEGV